MDIRELRPDDASRIQEVARESLTESYGHSLQDDTIEEVLDQWYGSAAFDELMGDGNRIFIVAEDDDIFGYAQGELLQDEVVIGDIHWIHVRPTARGNGVGTQLLGDIVDRMQKKGATLVRGRVLEVNEDGSAFFEKHDFTQQSSRTVEIGDEEHEETGYEKHLDDDASDVREEVTGPDGQELTVDYTAGETGVLAPLYPTYLDEAMNDQYGWLCRNCESTTTTMDTAGRIQCNNCDNARKATRWDNSYL